MYIIAGLGNPGREYEHTRHNAGFDVLDVLAERGGIRVESREHQALTGKGDIGGRRVILVKPQTYMNLSGESIRALAEYYKIDVTSELLVISDDIALPVGSLRIRKKGSAGGHNGLENIIRNLATDGFARVRVGVGSMEQAGVSAEAIRANQHNLLIHHVLGHVPETERELYESAIETAALAVECALADGIDAAMNRFNTKKEKRKKETSQKENDQKEKIDLPRAAAAGFSEDTL